jgi:hypothetical protein
MEPVGIEEWSNTRRTPSVLYLKRADNGRKAVISDTLQQGWPSFDISDAYSGESAGKGLNLALNHRETYAVESALFTNQMIVFELRGGDIFPAFGELFQSQVYKDSGGIVLERVTDKIPKPLRPAGTSRTISLADYKPSLFWERYPQYRDYMEFDIVELTVNRETSKANLALKPHGLVSGPDALRRLQRKLEVVEVAKGELLQARGRSYKVLNVVPPQVVDGVGVLVGWIELAPDSR